MSSSKGHQHGPEANQITHVLNKDKKYLSEHGQKLFNAINCLLEDNEQLELTQALFKYQKDHNVFTLVRSCRELFDSPKKKSLMLFMRPVIPVKDRFHYDEYYKLFFPEEFASDVKSIFSDLIPKDLLEKTFRKVDEKKKISQQKEENEKIEAIKILEKANLDLNLDLQKLKEALDSEEKALKVEGKPKLTEEQKNCVKIAGFRIIDLEPNEDESLGFDVCLGPTGTFIMISYVEPGSLVEKLGMLVGDELVSVNEISFKMIDLDQAIEYLSTAATLRIVLQSSGFMPEVDLNQKLASDCGVSQLSEHLLNFEFNNEWNNSFGQKTTPPSDSKTSLKKFIRRVLLRLSSEEDDLGFKIRGGIENSLGIFISHVSKNSTADLIGLKVCDQIIEVNGQTFSRITHEDAVLILKSSLINYKATKMPLKITVRYLSKIPLLQVVKSNKDSVTSIDKSFNYDTDIQLDKNYQSDYLEKLKALKYETNLVKSVDHFKMFKYFFELYLNKKISIQYFVYLSLNRAKLDKKILLESENIGKIIYNDDFSYFKRMLEFKITHDTNKGANSQYENIRFLNDDFKNGFIVRSTEVLNDLNINRVRKFNKFENIDSKKYFECKKMSRSMDCLNQIF
ncbi:unnamed protein product [Brachionus calyciflorus]|uniref:PDZ domain-containing protein n=1 Tax=Brachionus calyciflorus TaxID=104777 RepID=A0A813SHS6_9BILA|nr:unnamed protein product [Brachionus calyciflorus]